MASRDLNLCDTKLHSMAVDFLCHCNAAGLRVFIDCTYRTKDEQAALYAQGRTAPGKIVTHAKPGESAHNFERNGKPASRAFDIAIYEEETGQILDWNVAHDIGRDLGLIVGADLKGDLCDPPHFEQADWRIAT